MIDENAATAIGVSVVLGFFFGMYVGDDMMPHPIKTKRPITPTRIEVTINPETMASDTTYIYIEKE